MGKENKTDALARPPKPGEAMGFWGELTQPDENTGAVRGWRTESRGKLPTPVVARKPGFPVLGTLITLVGVPLVYYGIEAILSGNGETITEGACVALPLGLIAESLGVSCFKDWYDGYVASRNYNARRNS
jgi:hypothetical protein